MLGPRLVQGRGVANVLPNPMPDIQPKSWFETWSGPEVSAGKQASHVRSATAANFIPRTHTGSVRNLREK